MTHTIDDTQIRAWVTERGQTSASSLLTIGVKDIIDVHGLPTRAGSRILADAPPAAADAPVVAQLRQAGAVILGKTATTEFASFDPAPTRNPRNLAHTPGGSSSGSAAAVAAGMCDAALGTQTLGSILRPASYCGVLGLKPTYGTISTQGVLPLAESLDHVGFFAKDAATALRLAELFLQPAAPLKNPVIGIPDRYFTPLPDEPLRALEAIGCRLRPVTLPATFDAAPAIAQIIMQVEAARAHRPWFPARRPEYGHKLAALLEAGHRTTALDYLEARRQQQQATEDTLRLFEEVDILATPTTPTTAPAGLASTGDPIFNTPFSLFGLPALNIPATWTPEGLPTGLQLVTRPHHDTQLLHLAQILTP